MKDRSIGLILLCIFLILTGLLGLTNFKFDYQNLLMGVLAIGGGVFLLLGK
jgi:hypothetical protein